MTKGRRTLCHEATGGVIDVAHRVAGLGAGEASRFMDAESKNKVGVFYGHTLNIALNRLRSFSSPLKQVKLTNNGRTPALTLTFSKSTAGVPPAALAVLVGA